MQAAATIAQRACAGLIGSWVRSMPLFIGPGPHEVCMHFGEYSPKVPKPMGRKGLGRGLPPGPRAGPTPWAQGGAWGGAGYPGNIPQYSLDTMRRPKRLAVGLKGQPMGYHRGTPRMPLAGLCPRKPAKGPSFDSRDSGAMGRLWAKTPLAGRSGRLRGIGILGPQGHDLGALRVFPRIGYSPGVGYPRRLGGVFPRVGYPRRPGRVFPTLTKPEHGIGEYPYDIVRRRRVRTCA